VGLALALAPDPEVLILDEPTSGLDLFIRREFLASMVELAGAGRTILLSSHGIAEVERVASHAAFLAEGRLLLAASIEELRKRLVRVRIRFEGVPPDPAGLGSVLEFESSGRLWQAVLQDPDRAALEELRRQDGVLDLEETSLNLEEMYTALLARYHRPAGPQTSANGRRPPDSAGLADWGPDDRAERHGETPPGKVMAPYGPEPSRRRPAPDDEEDEQP
jgi:ABC-2 type transport system ATP-binding protein